MPSTREQRRAKGFTILAVAEGAISKEDAALSKKEYRKKLAKSKYPSVSYEVADRISERLGLEVRWQFRDIQRGGSPCPFTTECFVHVLAQQQQRPSWMRGLRLHDSHGKRTDKEGSACRRSRKA